MSDGSTGCSWYVVLTADNVSVAGTKCKGPMPQTVAPALTRPYLAAFRSPSVCGTKAQQTGQMERPVDDVCWMHRGRPSGRSGSACRPEGRAVGWPSEAGENNPELGQIPLLRTSQSSPVGAIRWQLRVGRGGVSEDVKEWIWR